jgi:hypothetical protein
MIAVRFHDEFNTTDSKRLCDMFSAFKVVTCAAGKAKIAPSSVNDAREYLDGKASNPFKIAVLSCEIGQSIWAEAEGVCCAGALDQHSERLLARSLAIFENPMMPTHDDVDSVWNNVSLDEIKRGQICDVLHEALRDALESAQQWSQLGFESSAPPSLFSSTSSVH